MVLPWGKQQELSAHAGFHPAATGLGEVGETVFLKDNQREAFVEGGTHDGFLTLGDAGRDEDGALTGLLQEILHLGGNLFVGEAAGALHLQKYGTAEEEAVADG